MFVTFTTQEIIDGLELTFENPTPSLNLPHSSTDDVDFSLVLRGVPDGERDDKIFRFACSCRGRRLRQREVESLVLHAAQQCSPPFPEQEALAKVRQAFKYPSDNDQIDTAQRRVQSLLAEPKRLRETAFAPEAIGALAVVRKEDPGLWAQVKGFAKGFTKELDRAVRKGSLQVISPGEGAQSPTVGATLTNLGIGVPAGCENLVLPRSYQFSDKGVSEVHFSKDGEVSLSDVAPTCVLVSGKREDASSGEQFLDIAYYQPGQEWKTLTAQRASCLTAHLVCEHANRGLPVASSNCRQLSKFLFDFEQANSETLKTQHVSCQLGWTGGDPPRAFLLGDRCIGDNAIRFHPADAGDDQFAKGFRAAGDFKTWLDAAEQALQYPRVATFFYAAVTAVM